MIGFAVALLFSPYYAAAAGQGWKIPYTHVQSLNDAGPIALEQPGQTTLVNFWATWCHACRGEIPELNALYKTVQNNPNIRVVGLAMNSGSPRQVEQFVRKHNMKYPIGTARVSSLSSRFRLFGFPITLIVDRNGIVRRRLVGAQSEKVLRDALLSVMKADAAS